MCHNDLHPLDSKQLRNALGQFPTGVAVVTTPTSLGKHVGMTISSFNSLSLNPALVCWAIANESGSYDAFARCANFRIAVLAEDQQGLAIHFASRGIGKFDRIPTQPFRPVSLPGVAAQFDCRTYCTVEMGDHLLIVGQVVDFQSFSRMPLVFAQGQFQRLADNANHAARPKAA